MPQSLLASKGTMSEAELHVLKQRMLEGKLAKARRGELGMRVAMGYVRRPSGETIRCDRSPREASAPGRSASSASSGTTPTWCRREGSRARVIR
jgi:hypothetical protein